MINSCSNPGTTHLDFFFDVLEELLEQNKLPDEYDESDQYYKYSLRYASADLLRNINPYAIEIFLKLANKINIKNFMSGSLKLHLSRNPDPRLTEFIKSIRSPCKKTLCSNINPSIVQFVLENPEHIDHCFLSGNQTDLAVDYYLKHPNLIDWSSFSANPNPKAIEFCKLFGNIDQLTGLVRNPNPDGFIGFLQHVDLNNLTFNEVLQITLNPCVLAINLMESKPEIIFNNPHGVFHNPNPKIINLLRTHLDKIYNVPRSSYLLDRADLFLIDKLKMNKFINKIEVFLL